MTKRDSGIVGLVRGVSARYEKAEEKLTKLEAEGRQLQKKLPKMLSDIESLEASISESTKEIAELQARRDELRNEYFEASFNGDGELQREITAERAGIDETIEKHTAEREKAQANLNRLRGSLNSTREEAFSTLDELELPDTEAFIDALIDALKEQRESLEKRMHAAGLLYELPSEREQREETERRAEMAREAARKAQERQELIDRRNYFGKLLNNLSGGIYPHTGHRAWAEYLHEHGIETVITGDGEPIFYGDNEEGKRTRLEPQSIVADVKAEYVKAMQELGEPVEEPERPARQPKMTRSSFVSVM